MYNYLSEVFVLIKVSPSILAADFAHLAEALEAIKDSGAEFAHLDVMDGDFVPNISFGFPVIKDLRRVNDLVFDTHLMISHPLKYIKEFAKAGSDMITFHLESADDPKEVIAAIKNEGKKCGISIKPATKAESLLPFIDDIDFVLVMTVEPGFGGQSFMFDMLDKIRRIKELKPDLVISVDGGINEKTAEVAKEAGAEILVAGSFFFSADDKKEVVRKLKA